MLKIAFLAFLASAGTGGKPMPIEWQPGHNFEQMEALEGAEAFARAVVDIEERLQDEDRAAEQISRFLAPWCGEYSKGIRP